MDWRKQLIDACDKAPPPLALPSGPTRNRDPEYMRKWYRVHREQLLAEAKEHYANDTYFAERRKALVREWEKANPDKVNAKNAARRAKAKNDCPSVKALYRLARCLRAEGRDVHVDHIYPLSKGGPHVFENLRIITAIENMRKGNKIP